MHLEVSGSSGGQLGDGLRMTKVVGRLQIDEVGYRLQCTVEPLFGNHHGERRLGVENGLPRVGLV
jgi:hypothetical protein